MKRFIVTLALCALPMAAGASFFTDAAPASCASAAGASFEPVFSAPGTLSPAVVNELAGAKKSIRVAARDFTSKPVSEALLRAGRGGTDLKIVLNKKTNLTVASAAQFLTAMSMPPHLTKADDVLFSDYIVVDEKDVIVGDIASFADDVDEGKSAGSVLIIHNAPELAKKYLANWQGLWDASEVMKPEK